MSNKTKSAVAEKSATVAKEETKSVVKTRKPDYAFKVGKIEVGVRLNKVDRSNVGEGSINFLKEILAHVKRALKIDLYISPGRLSVYIPQIKGKQFTLDQNGRCIHVGENMKLKGSLDHETPKRQLQIFYTDPAECAIFNLARNPYAGSTLTLKGKTVIDKAKKYVSISGKDFAARIDSQIQG